MYQCLVSDWNNKVEKKIQSVIRQVEKYGFSASYRKISTEIKTVPYYETDGIVRTKVGEVPVEVVNYEFNMPDFKVGNYTPVAVIEHNVVENADVTNMVHLINNFENAPKSWWTIDGHCDDCNDKYSRKKTVMLLNNDDGSFRQIGTSCLKRYLGITCFNVIHNYMLVEELVEEELAVYGDNFNKYQSKYCRTNNYLACIYDVYAKFGGYIKEKTIDEAVKLAKDKNYIPSEESVKKAQECIEYFNNLNVDEQSDFVRNVKVTVISKYVKYWNGYLACAPDAMIKLKERVAKHSEDAKSQFVGSKGEKLTVDVVVTSSIGFETRFGYSYMNIFRSTESNVFVWVTSTKSYSVGLKLRIMGTVKEHQEYNGVKQTVLTRVKEV